jgi:hypothetical protein
MLHQPTAKPRGDLLLQNLEIRIDESNDLTRLPIDVVIAMNVP